MYMFTKYQSPVGTLTLISDGNALNSLWNARQKYYDPTADEGRAEQTDLPLFKDVRRWLDAYFAGKRPAIAGLPLAPIGGEFRQVVWDVLCGIPYGEVCTYGDVAKAVAAKMNKPRMSGQAVGGAVGHNPISIIIPCHRVVGANGSLTGYGGGIQVKEHLLAHEGLDMSRFTVPTKGTAL